MTQTILAYAAGLIDGEGSICLSRSHKNTSRRPVVSVPSCSKELVLFMFDHFGGTIVAKKTYRENHSPSWEWRLRDNAALEFLGKVRPYLQETTKLARAELLLSQYKLVTVRNGRYTDAQKTAKKAFEHSFFEVGSRNV